MSSGPKRRSWLAVTLLAGACLRLAAQTFEFSTVAGHPGYGSDNEGYGAPHGSADGRRDAARFYVPSGVAVDSQGTLYVADTNNHTVRRITLDGVVTTVAGLAGSGGGVDGVGARARFFLPEGIVVDGRGTLFVADTQNCTLRRISPDGTVTTLAGPAGGTYGRSEGAGYADGAGGAARFLAPTGLALDSLGNLFVADRGNHVIRKVTSAGVVTTVAGAAGVAGSANGGRSEARFNEPTGVAVDGAGNVFVADHRNNEIRKIAADGTVTTLAGDSAYSLGNQDGVGRAARFGRPRAVALDPSGNLLVLDAGPSTLRRVTMAGAVTTLAGWAPPYTASPSVSPYELSSPLVDSPGPGARFNNPAGLAVDRSGNIVVADSNNNVIRQRAANGVVSTVAGPGSSNGSADGAGSVARFNYPRGMAADASGNTYVADSVSHTIRRMDPSGWVTTVAGQPGAEGAVDGPAGQARFFFPYGVAVDAHGNVFVADRHNHTVRQISPAGLVTTVAGLAGVPGNVDGPAQTARFYLPGSVAVDRDGNVYVADTGNGVIRKIVPGGLVSTVAVSTPYSDFGFRAGQAVAVDATGVVYFADGNRVRKLARDGTITTLAGSAPIPTRGGDASYARVDGPAEVARFTGPTGLAVDLGGNVYVTDGAVRQVRPDGFVTTIGGNGGSGGTGVGHDAGFLQAYGVAVDRDGALLVSDLFHNTLRRGVPAVVPGRLGNFSILTHLAEGETLTLGTIIGGAGTAGNKPILVRAAGPSLAPFGLTGLLADPRLEFYSGSNKIIEADNWGSAPNDLSLAFGQLGAFPFLNASSDAALNLLSIPAGEHTVRVTGQGGRAGVVLAEIYEGTIPAMIVPTLRRLTNLSVLKNLGPGGLTAGFIIRGTSSLRLLVRVAGPALAGFGLNGWLVDPRLELFDGTGRSLASNDNWGDQERGAAAATAAFAQVGAFRFPDARSKDAALVTTLAPGAYTVQVRGADPLDGLVLVELYEFP